MASRTIISVTGNETLTGNLTVTGTSTFTNVSASFLSLSSNQAIGGNLTVSGTSNLPNINSSGTINGKTLALTGNETIGGNLAITGNITVGPRLLVSAINPTNSFALNTTTNLTNWTEIVDTNSNFDSPSGVYTVPETGYYELNLVANYTTSSALTTQLTGSTPSFQIIDSGTNAVLLSSSLPTLNISLALILTINELLTTGQVTINGVISLTQGQTILPRYFANSVSITTTISVSTSGTTTFSIRKLQA